MEYNKCIINFWFHQMSDAPGKIEIIKKEVKDLFPKINVFSGKGQIPLDHPLVNAITEDKCLIVNMSAVNFQLAINYIEDEFSSPKEYMKYISDQAKRFFEMLIYDLNIEVVYAAVLHHGKVYNDDSINILKNNLLSSSLTGEYVEMGAKYTEVVDKSFYKNIGINSANQISFKEGAKGFYPPLLSLSEVASKKDSLVINYELTDKYLYDKDSSYKIELSSLKAMLKYIKTNMENELNEMLNLD